MDQSLSPQHNCGAMTEGIAPSSACSEVAGIGATGIIILIAIALGLGLIGWLLWRRMKRME